MAVWKLSIKMSWIEEKSYDAFEQCRSNQLIGVGWSVLFDKHRITNLEESYAALKAEGDNRNTVELLMEQVKTGDLVWLHHGGFYYLCRVKNDQRLFGPEICADFRKYHLGHARKADWVKVPHPLVPGRVQRAVIARRTMQRIRCLDSEENVFGYIFDKLRQNKDWRPHPDDSLINEFFKNIKAKTLEAILTSDDYEDMVAGYLQSQGWILVKSTCSRSTPEFEFMMVRPGPRYAFVQVKSGDTRLSAKEYEKYVKPNIQIFLLSNPEDASAAPEGVTVIDRKVIFEWAAKNYWALAPALFTRIQCAVEAEAASARLHPA